MADTSPKWLRRFNHQSRRQPLFPRYLLVHRLTNTCRIAMDLACRISYSWTLRSQDLAQDHHNATGEPNIADSKLQFPSRLLGFPVASLITRIAVLNKVCNIKNPSINYTTAHNDQTKASVLQDFPHCLDHLCASDAADARHIGVPFHRMSCKTCPLFSGMIN